MVHGDVGKVGRPYYASAPAAAYGDVGGGERRAGAVAQAEGSALIQSQGRGDRRPRGVRQLRASLDEEAVGVVPAVPGRRPRAAVGPVEETPVAGVPGVESREARAQRRVARAADAVGAAGGDGVAEILGDVPDDVPILLRLQPNDELELARVVNHPPQDGGALVVVQEGDLVGLHVEVDQPVGHVPHLGHAAEPAAVPRAAAPVRLRPRPGQQLRVALHLQAVGVLRRGGVAVARPRREVDVVFDPIPEPPPPQHHPGDVRVGRKVKAPPR